MSRPEGTSSDPDDTPEPFGEPESFEKMVSEIRNILGEPRMSARMEQMMRRDLDAIHGGQPRGGAGAGAGCQSARCDYLRAQLPWTARDQARADAAAVIADARRRGAEIIAAAQVVADRYTDQALDQAGRALQTARRATQRATAWTTVERAVPALAPAPGAADRKDTPVAAHWYAALSAAGVLFPVAEPAVVATLAGYVRVLSDNSAGAAASEVAHRVGTELVAFGITQPAALAATLRILAQFLAGSENQLPVALVGVLSTLAAGFTEALRNEVLRQQEALHRATRAAVDQTGLAPRSRETQRLVRYDPLTGLANRRTLLHQLRNSDSLAGTDQRIGLCLIDLDGFKRINDQHGVDNGDRVLAAVAQRLKELIRDSDYLLARCGSDEFAILVEDCAGTAHLVDLADRVLAALWEPVGVPGVTVRLRAHVGIVVTTPGQADGARMLIDAEIAVHKARKSDDGWAIQEPAGHTAVAAAPVMADLHTIPLLFQPIVGLGDGQVHGMQTVARWQHPHLGDLDLRRIGELTGSPAAVREKAAVLLRQVCQQAQQWGTAPHAPYLAVELPVLQLGYPDVVELVRHALTETGLPPQRLQLQLSGIDTLPTQAHAHTVLAGLDTLGVRIAVDGSRIDLTHLAALRNLPVHELRTPASTGSGPATDTDRALLTAMADVAHSMNMTLTVHGVDNPAHAAALRDTGCDTVQGRHYGRPATATQCGVLLNPRPVLRRSADTAAGRAS